MCAIGRGSAATETQRQTNPAKNAKTNASVRPGASAHDNNKRNGMFRLCEVVIPRGVLLLHGIKCSPYTVLRPAT